MPRSVETLYVDLHSSYARVRHQYHGDDAPTLGVGATRHVLFSNDLLKFIESAVTSYRARMAGLGYLPEEINEILYRRISESTNA